MLDFKSEQKWPLTAGEDAVKGHFSFLGSFFIKEKDRKRSDLCIQAAQAPNKIIISYFKSLVKRFLQIQKQIYLLHKINM